MRTAMLLSLLLLSACGPEKGSTATEGTSGSEGSSVTGSSGTAGEPSTGVPTTGGTGEPASCDAFLPDALGPKVEITLVHTGSAPVWVPAASCAGLPRLKILDAALEDYFSAGSDCSPTQCEEFMTLDVCEKSCDACGAPSIARLDPGARFTINWPGGRGVKMQITSECAPGLDCPGSCERATQAAAGSYAIELPAFRSCTGGCECDEPGENGWCPIFAAANVSEPVSFTAQLAYPGMTAIDVEVSDP